MQTPLVSIIIPTYNRAHLIGETLDSVLAQTYTNWECIVVDDGSTDNTDELLATYCVKDSRFQYHHRPANRPKGANACRNYGFELSKGAYVSWFDSDDLMHRDRLKIQISSLHNTNFNFSVCQAFVFIDSVKNVIGLRHEKIYSDNTFEEYLKHEIIWITSSAIWKRVFIQTMDYLFDEELQAAQEWEFHCRALFFSPNYHVIKKPLVYIRKHDASISYNNNNELRFLNNYNARDKIFKFLNNKNIKNDYLINYIISYYKYFLIRRYFLRSFNILITKIVCNKNIVFMYKIKSLLAFPMYIIFNKGEFILKGKRLKS